jgi:hypothetical protein
VAKSLKIILALSIGLPLFLSTPPASSANITYTFVPGGATGIIGPTQAQLNSAYLYTTLDGLVTSNNGIQEWVVPSTGDYIITAIGAGGGSGINGPSMVTYAGGKGASLTGTFSLTAGTTLRIIVGQVGVNAFNQSNWYGAGGGGGGSFVYVNANDTYPLIAAGGGGGGSATLGVDAQTTTSGTNGNGDTSGTTASKAVGNGGNLASTSYSGGAGAGWLSDGAKYANTCAGFGTAAQSPRTGGKGGYSNTLLANGTGSDVNVRQGNGGFGGGGAGNGACTIAGPGGGGGYSGGGGGGNFAIYRGAGGGGSYNGGSNPSANGVTNTGNGSVEITKYQAAPASFNSLALQGNARAATYRNRINLVANVDVISKVTFMANGKRIPGCTKISTSGTSPNIVATCSWIPSTRGAITLTAIAYSSGSGNDGTQSSPLNVSVSTRSTLR